MNKRNLSWKVTTLALSTAMLLGACANDNPDQGTTTVPGLGTTTTLPGMGTTTMPGVTTSTTASG